VAYFDKNPEVRICQTEELWIRNGVRVNPKERHRKTSGMIFERSLELCLVSPSAVMLSRDLLADIGPFDEALPACEDYDLWLRISCRFPVFLIDKPLIIKRGGHTDQLSRQAGLDQYRIRSIVKLIETNTLTTDQVQSAIRVMKKKCHVYAKGCAKRGRRAEAEHYRRLAKRYNALLDTHLSNPQRIILAESH
jgi:GT2 family glycosyltransferase